MKKLNLMSRVKLTGPIACLACLFFLAGVADATPLFDNLGSAYNPTYNGYDDLTWGAPLFDSFLVGKTGTTLFGVELMLRGSPSSSSSSGSFSVALYSNSPVSSVNPLPSPGKLLLTIGTMSDKALPSTWSGVYFWLPQPDNKLLANTRYWVELNSTSGSTVEWAWSLDQDAPGVTGEYFGNCYDYYGKTYVSVNQNDTIFDGVQYGPYEMYVITPLPAAVWLLGSGLAVLGLWRGRKLFKA